MILLVQWLIFGHIHKWKILTSNLVTYKYLSGSTSIGTRYVLQCEHCGNMKTFETNKN